MLVYLSKKIAIPNKVNLNCISWNRDQGSIACGGDNGLLKVLLLDPPNGKDALLQGVAASSSLSSNQTLEGHDPKVSVLKCAWNPFFKKLTSSDQSGLVIVWMQHKGAWFEEMVNNRNKSYVTDMKWSNDGKKIAIIYEDGAVIVGSVDGSRLWGKDLQYSLQFVEWSPDGKLLMFVTKDSEILLYDGVSGEFIKKYTTLLTNSDSKSLITGIHWYAPLNINNYYALNQLARNVMMIASSSSSNNKGKGSNINNTLRMMLPSTLCIAYSDGLIQLSRGEDEASREVIDTKLASINFVKWSNRGNILAVVGKEHNNETNCFVKFYDCYGRYLRSIKVSGNTISELTWENNDLRIALAVDSFIYFANIRHTYNWTYFNDVICYSYPRNEFNHQYYQQQQNILVFYDMKLGKPTNKQVNGNILMMFSKGSLCALVVVERILKAITVTNQLKSNKSNRDDDDDDDDDNKDKNLSETGSHKELCEVSTIQLRNSIGSIIDTKLIPFTPSFSAMTEQFVIVANHRTVFLWQYQNIKKTVSKKKSSQNIMELNDDENDDSNEVSNVSRNNKGKSRIFDITDPHYAHSQTPENFTMISESLQNPITAITANNNVLIIARKNGDLLKFSLPHISLEFQYNIYYSLLQNEENSNNNFSNNFNEFKEDDNHSFVGPEVSSMKLNCNSTRLACVDAFGLFTVLDLEHRITNKRNDELQDEEVLNNKEDEDEEDASDKQEQKIMYLSSSLGKKLNIEKKDVWDYIWSEENPLSFVIMEKTKMTIYHDDVPEDSIVSSAYLARFQDLEVRVVALDSLYQLPDKQLKENFIIDVESKKLRDLREIIMTKGLHSALDYLEKLSLPSISSYSTSSSSSTSSLFINPSYNRLWKLFAESCLDELEFSLAERAFVYLQDYHGIKFCKSQLSTSNNKEMFRDKFKQRAEVYVYLKNISQAESVYIDMERKDLAINLRKKMGDYPKVGELVASNSNGIGSNLAGGMESTDSWNDLGDYYKDRMNWKKASEYYRKANNYVQLVDCLYLLKNYSELERLVIEDEIPKSIMVDISSFTTAFTAIAGSSNQINLHLLLARRFETVGMVNPALVCYLLAARDRDIDSTYNSDKNYNSYNNNIIKLAIDCAIRFNSWKMAFYLSAKFNFPQIESRFLNLINQANNDPIKKLQIIQLLRRAGRTQDAIFLTNNLSHEILSKQANPTLAKKLNVMMALQVELHRGAQSKITTTHIPNNTVNNGATVTLTPSTFISSGDDYSSNTDPILDALHQCGFTPKRADELEFDFNKDKKEEKTTAQPTIAQATAMTIDKLLLTSFVDGGSMTLDSNTVIGATLQQTINTLGAAATTSNISRSFSEAWRSAAAYHYYILALRQFYQAQNSIEEKDKEKYYSMAIKTSIKVAEYEDILGGPRALSILALSAIKGKFYGLASKAFVKLETSQLSPIEREKVESLAIQIFNKHQPVNPTPLNQVYMDSLDYGKRYDACLLTGRAIQDKSAYTCRVCRHSILSKELSDYKYNPITNISNDVAHKGLQNCPLCHSPIPKSHY